MKKILLTLMALIFVIAFALPIKTDASQVFSDVSASHPNYNDINYLLNKGVISKSSKFGVSDIVTREEVAVMVAKAVGLDGKQRVTKFKDVPQSNINSGYIQSAVDAGIIKGYSDGTFKPTTKVTRGHMAAFIARAFDLPKGSKTFKDVPVDHTAYEAVKQLVAANITTGYGDGTFKPQDNLTRAHIAAFLARAMRYADGGSATITTDSIIKQFKADGLEVGQVSNLDNKEFGNGRKEGKRILIPSLGDDSGGRLFIFNDAKSLKQAREYYDELSSIGPIFYSHIHQNGLILLQMNGDMNDAKFKKYADSIDKVVSGLNATTTPSKPTPVVPSIKGEMKVHFIDVGQGDAILIQAPTGENILIDGGPRSAGNKVVSYLKSIDVYVLDYVVATHPDADHIGGLISVLNSLTVGQFVNSGKAHTTETYFELLNLVESKNIKYVEPKIEQLLIGGWTTDFYLQSIYVNAKASDTNDASIVLKAGYKDVGFLLMADASAELEDLLVRAYDTLKVQILKAGHHGSSTSSSLPFLRAVNPEVTILSYGKENSYGHPDTEVLSNLKAVGSKIYSTAQDGTIVVTTDGNTYSINVKEFNPPKVNPAPTVTQPVKETNTTTELVTQPELAPTPTTQTKEYFKNCTELNKVYPSGVQEGHPAYDKKMDRDGDGWACEK
ncbi:S-layer homology domain-containing protein [Lysinibacillus pakistanensis]|uniref:S-layer homology domain-containing protein n=1 Tax=Lysinibacillus pakistanensis TaxID=759811 RepID=UPI003D28543A